MPADRRRCVARERALRNQRRAAADQQHRNVDSENQERAQSLGRVADTRGGAEIPRRIVVTEIAAPTADVALVTSASMPAILRQARRVALRC